MDLKGLCEKRSVEITAVLTFILATVINQISQTPVIYMFTVVSLLGATYASRKFKEQFGVKLAFKRSEGWNLWAGAFGGLLAFSMSTYIQTVEAGFIRAISEILAITVFLTLMVTLFQGSLLQDIQRGEIDI